jgi:DNA-binding response OmpR family regulator
VTTEPNNTLKCGQFGKLRGDSSPLRIFPLTARQLGVIRELRNDPETAELLVVAFTACATSTDCERVVAAGFDGIITKPYNIASLHAEVRNYLDSGEAIRPSQPLENWMITSSCRL